MKISLKLILVVLLLANYSCKKTKVTEPIVDVTPPDTDSVPDQEPPIPYVPTTNMIFLNGDGSLGYNLYANQGERQKVNVVPDFSLAGYKKGGVAIPVVNDIKITLTATNGDNLSQIQTAINSVGNLTPDSEGIRGVILLKAGTYNVSNTLTINKSGVILRGEGQDENGTIIKSTRASQHNIINLHGVNTTVNRANLKKITTPYVGTGKKGFSIESGSGITVGDKIGIYKTPNTYWITDLNVAQFNWTPSGFVMDYERTVTHVIGDSILLDGPVVDPMQTKYGGGSVYKLSANQRISNSAVENMILECVYTSNTDENHAWIGVELKNAENCWVKGVTVKYLGYAAVSISSNSHYNTIEECAMLDAKAQNTGSRMYSFNIESGASFNLFQRCFARGGRHDFVTGSKVPGPNVFLDCVAVDTRNDIGPHHRWSTGLLFDNVVGGQIRVQNRGMSGTGHGWSGVQTMFYNSKSEKSDFKVDSPKGGINWGIGSIGVTRNGAGFWESWGTNVSPRSLYLAQLKDRLGIQAVENISIEAQRVEGIEQLLKDWAGNGKLSGN